jgi:nucleoside-diphosphate-sugar epimerase
MRVLIIGGSGAIGSAVARHANSAGLQTHVALRKTASLERLPDWPEIRRHVFDLREPDSLVAVIDTVEPDWILMAAFPLQVRTASALARRELLSGMSDGVLGLSEALGKVGYSGSLTWIGSAMSYGGQACLRRSTDAPRPATFRGAVKSAESLLAAQMAAELGISFTELRVFTGYGPFEQRGRLVSSLLRAGLTGDKVPLASTPARRDWVHYEDIARACIASAAPRAAGQGIFNVCSGRVRDTLEVATLLEEIAGKRLIAGNGYKGIEYYGNAIPGELPRSEDGLTWAPKIDLREGLEQCWRWACSAEGRDYLLQDAAVVA